MRPRARLAGALGLAALAVSLALPAAGSAALDVRGVDTSQYPRLRVTVVTDRPSQTAPRLTENGEAVVGSRSLNLGRAKSVVLLIDRSWSMRGRPIEDAKAAARAFIDAKDPADRIAVVTFGSRATQDTTFTTNRQEAKQALATLDVDRTQGTALYDAVRLGARLLGDEARPGRVLIVLTDGQDVSSHTSLGNAILAAKASRTLVYPIGIEGEQFTPDALRAMASETGGGYHGAASSSQLAQVYADLARELRRTWRIDFVTAAAPGTRVDIGVSSPGEPAASRALTLPGTPPKGSSGGSSLPAGAFTATGTLVLSLIVGMLLAAGAVLVFGKSRADELKMRLRPHVGKPDQLPKRMKVQEREKWGALKNMFRATERVFGKSAFWGRIERILDRSDLPLKAVELVYLMVGCAVGLALVFAIAGASPILVLLAFAGGAAGPYVFGNFKANRRTAAFEAQLPDLLMSIAASLKAGHSFKQGLQAIVDEGYDPASKEFKRVLTETQLGRPMDDALDDMADRIASKDFSFIVTAVKIQSQVGGSLAGLFDLVADTVRSRQQFARKIKALTAMGRASAYVLCGLPFFTAALITLINRNYMSPLFHSSSGHMMIIVGLIMMAIGSMFIRKIVSFKG